MDKCICESPNNKLDNTHCYNDRKIDLIIINRTIHKEDKGIVIFENNTAIASFDIKYCPMCGKKIIKE
jgi:hypothetical protein